MSFRPLTVRRAVAATAALALGAGALAAATAGPAAAAPSATRHAYPGSVPAFVRTAPDVGPTPVPAETTAEGEVYLPLKDEAGAQALATAVSTPGNAAYRHPLSPSAWIARFAPSQSDLTAVENYLRDSGLTIYAVPTSREYVVFRGPAPAMSAAFGTTLHNYRVQGKTVSAPATAPSVPASLAGKVLGISLGDARAKLTRPDNVQLPRPAAAPGVRSFATRSPGATTAEPSQCSSYWDEYEAVLPKAYGRTSFPTYLCGYLPGQLRSAGNVNQQINSGLDGTGQTIAITDAYASPTILRDTNDYMRAVGSPLLTTYSEIAPREFRDEEACAYPSGWQAEEAIDVQSAHSVAPGANILYVGGFNCIGGLDIAVSKVVDSKLADIVSNSWGNLGEAVPDDVLRGEQNIHIQAAGEGIGLYFSSGDSGDESVNLGYTSPDFPASSPFVTAVGGTSEAIGADGSYVGEIGWGDIRDQVSGGKYVAPLPGNEYRGGAGGGVSRNFAEPAYQKGVVPDSLARSGATGLASRVVPDIADLADPYTGFQIAIRPITDDATLATGPYQYLTYGGTSLASPIAAAKAALIQDAGGKEVGFANPAIYAAAKALPSGFHDVTAPSTPFAVAFQVGATKAHPSRPALVTGNQGLSLFTGRGYDTITGVGSLKVPQLAEFYRTH